MPCCGRRGVKYSLQNDEESGLSEAEKKRNRRKNVFKTVKLMAPYFWPKGKISLRLRVIICLSLIVVEKAVSLQVPLQFKNVVNTLSGIGPLDSEGSATTIDPYYPLLAIMLYGVFRLFSSSMKDIRDTIFLQVSQNATKMISSKTFRHLHFLDLNFHLKRKTGAVLRTMDRGTSAVQTLLRLLLFNILPTIIELFVVCGYMWHAYSGIYAAITFFCVAGYVGWTLSITEWRKKFRREMNDAENNTNDKAVDSLLNFETVKYFNAEEKEISRYTDALKNYFKVEFKTRYSLALLNFGQGFIITVGLAGALLLSARNVLRGTLNVGDLVAINMYILQLYGPLSWLGSSYRMIVQSFINMEQMFDLLEQQPVVRDEEGAGELRLTGGDIEFKDVDFAYGEKEILRGISFRVPAGKMIALVGSSGAGKSTIFRLLCRFYDPTSGTILVDGQDLRDVTQDSLRRHIGVVPQDTVLFNDTIRYNISYGAASEGREATEDEVVSAAAGARIDKFIADSIDGYDTLVGERGLRLSGGEKQRVAIARTIVKDPAILILDEATSALDTKTEREIQDTLMAVAKGRTTLVIAHRLSTVRTADEILVIHAGEILERGSHDSLIEQEGEYYNMWMQQLEGEKPGKAEEPTSTLIDL